MTGLWLSEEEQRWLVHVAAEPRRAVTVPLLVLNQLAELRLVYRYRAEHGMVAATAAGLAHVRGEVLARPARPALLIVDEVAHMTPADWEAAAEVIAAATPSVRVEGAASSRRPCANRYSAGFPGTCAACAVPRSLHRDLPEATT